MTWLIAKKCLSHNLSLSNLVFSAFVTSPNMSYQCCFNLNNTTSALVEQKLLIITTRMLSLPVFSWIRVSQTLSSVWCFLCHWLSFCLFFFLPMHWVFFFFQLRLLVIPLVSSNFHYGERFSLKYVERMFFLIIQKWFY